MGLAVDMAFHWKNCTEKFLVGASILANSVSRILFLVTQLLTASLIFVS